MSGLLLLLLLLLLLFYQYEHLNVVFKKSDLVVFDIESGLNWNCVSVLLK
jgi:hypothetical protein